MKKIAKEIQDRILNETGIISIIHIGESKCDVLLGSGWGYNIDDNKFESLLSIVREFQMKYPDKVEGICADITGPDTLGYIVNGEFIEGVSYGENGYVMPNFNELQKN